MYQPPHFVEPDLATKHALVRERPLGLLISGGADGLVANPVPFLLDADVGPLGRLRTHLARANPQWKALAAGAEVLVVFQGPDAYVTPSWYASKREHGKVVPTWNYAMVQARGTVTVHEDADWLHAQASALTDTHEARRANPWAIDDAPEPFVAMQLRAIVGIEIAITALDGKWKVSQNRPEPDRAGVALGLGAEETPGAAAMRDLVAARLRPASDTN